MLLALLNLLILGGLLGFVAATGRLDKAKWQTITDLLRHPGSPAGLREKVADLMQPATTTAPDTQPAALLAKSGSGYDGEGVGGAASSVASAADRIQFAQQAMEQERLRLERDAQDLLQRQRLLDAQRADVQSKLAKIDDERKQFQTLVQTTTDKTKADNFARSLSLYNELKPKQIKELFLGLQEDVIRDYLVAMDPDLATKVIAEFKSPEERALIGKVLEKIRIDGTSSALSATTQAASASPTAGTGGGATRN